MGPGSSHRTSIMKSAISARNLSKTYIVHERSGGLRAALRGVFRREKKEVEAVKSISFEIQPGEIIGFLGPNGAGKTTTLKMLSGLLHPTGGQGFVLGYEPHKREKDFLKQITLVTGQRNQLVWDIPAIDSFEVNQAVYDIDREQFRRTVDEYIELLELQELVRKPVRQLSLGERMKVEIAAALLHRPKVLFLDEPTLGLDVPMQRRIRRFIADYNKQEGATVLLTSHYMSDVQALCKRVIVIHQGEILFDGQLSHLVQQFTGYKEIVVEPKERGIDLSRYGEIMGEDAGRVSFRIPREEVPAVAAKLLADIPMFDLSVEEPPIEDVIERVFAGGNIETAS
ncbi:MAG: ATP-binding cassette domain-containing protein [Anaerolineae bacterium]|nr:MAG: ATP-binding cassette domain-containing protein [Anaerolineae bacterium]